MCVCVFVLCLVLNMKLIVLVNILLQAIYLAIIGATYYYIVNSSFNYIPGPYISEVHRFFSLSMFVCVLSFIFDVFIMSNTLLSGTQAWWELVWVLYFFCWLALLIQELWMMITFPIIFLLIPMTMPFILRKNAQPASSPSEWTSLE